jgi:hypothetical protein
MWVIGIRMYQIKMPWAQTAKITAASLVASAVAYFASVSFAPLLACVIGGTGALVVLLILFYVFRVLEPEDRARLVVLSGMLPKRIAAPVDKIISILVRSELASPTPSNV